LETLIFHIVFTVLFVLANVVFAKAILYRVSLVFNGQKASFHEDFREHKNLAFRIKSFLFNVLLQKKNFQEPLRGLMHAFIFYGFITYLIHTTNQMVAGMFGYWMNINELYAFSLIGLISQGLNHAYEFAVQGVSFLVLLGLGFFAWRRWIAQAKGLDVHSPASAIVIGMISTLMISTLLGEGAKSISSTFSEQSNQSFIAAGIGGVFSHMGLSAEGADTLFKIMWWGHILTVFTFMFYVPTSKHGHLIYAPMNYFFATDTPRGQLSKLNLEDENALWGSNKVQDFPWPSLMDGLSCIECGRCQVQCPANRTGKVLNPKAIIVELKHALMEQMPGVAEARKQGKSAEEILGMETNVIGDKYISEEAIWGCTTCYACVEACPVGNNQVNAIVEMRRHLVLAESKFPAELQGAFTNMENNSNPWGVGAHTRADWAEGLGVKTMAEDSEVDVLYWVGCAGAFDERSKSTARSLVKIMQKANVKFGILGTEESCSGDSARRGGNEYLYQTLAQANVDVMNGYKVKKVVTACPHCYNTIKNEYPQFGGNFEVIHHSEFINTLIDEKKISVDITAEDTKQSIAYHDPCYLGRYNNGYENPRAIVNAVSGSNLKEAEDHHSKSLCCGAGGAQMWMEEQNNDRVNIKRTNQLLDTGASTIAVSCPFCMTMMTDGVKSAGKVDSVKVKDIAELVAEKIS
jgi:Fe-S oxidoreductase